MIPALLSPRLSLFLYVGVFVAAAVACLASVPLLERVDDPDTRRGLAALLVTSGGWSAGQAGLLAAPTAGLKVGSYVAGLVLGFATVGGWLYFCSAYTGRAYHHNPTYRRAAVAVFVVVTGIKLTNPLHGAYFTVVRRTAPFPHLAVQTGALHWTVMGLAYALAFVGFFMLFELFTAVDYDTRPLAVLAALTGLPAVLNVVGYTTPLLIDMSYEPLGVAVFALGVTLVYLDRFEAVRLAAERETPVIALDSEGRVRDVNQTARRLFPALRTARGDPLETALPAVADRLDSDEPILEVERNESAQYFRVTETPFGTAKAGLGRTVVFTDVTEQERYRRELERQNERLELFASMVSHDLRNPLNVAQGRLDLAREQLDGENPDLEAVARAHERMEELISEILTLTRQGAPVEHRDAVRLSSVCRECWGMVETADAELVVESDLAFEAEPDRLKRLFENLFRNATEHAGPDATITVGALADRSGFYVADDGPGIPEEDRESVFDAGYTTHEEGTGFGLAIVAEIVDAHNWEVTVTESEDGGARFEVIGITPLAEDR